MAAGRTVSAVFAGRSSYDILREVQSDLRTRQFSKNGTLLRSSDR